MTVTFPILDLLLYPSELCTAAGMCKSKKDMPLKEMAYFLISSSLLASADLIIDLEAPIWIMKWPGGWEAIYSIVTDSVREKISYPVGTVPGLEYLFVNLNLFLVKLLL